MEPGAPHILRQVGQHGQGGAKALYGAAGDSVPGCGGGPCQERPACCFVGAALEALLQAYGDVGAAKRRRFSFA